MTQSVPIINTQEQFEVALQLAEDAFRHTLDQLRLRFTARMKDEAWGDPAKAADIRAEWDAEIEAARLAHHARVKAIPKPPTATGART